MQQSFRVVGLAGALGLAVFVLSVTTAFSGQRCTFCKGMTGETSASAAPTTSGGPQSPAEGYDIHVQAPHLMADGQVGGPFHHYCKPISDPKAKLVAIEYFIAKSVTRKEVPLIKWHRYFHDHKVEIATGRVQVLDMPPDQAAKVAEAAAKTDGIIFHLWHKDQVIPDGRVSIPQSLGHIFTRPE